MVLVGGRKHLLNTYILKDVWQAFKLIPVSAINITFFPSAGPQPCLVLLLGWSAGCWFIFSDGTRDCGHTTKMVTWLDRDKNWGREADWEDSGYVNSKHAGHSITPNYHLLHPAVPICWHNTLAFLCLRWGWGLWRLRRGYNTKPCSSFVPMDFVFHCMPNWNGVDIW